MKKPIMLGVALACATLVTGCGNPHEKMVKEMYAVVQSGDRDKADKFCEQNFAPGLEDLLKYNRDTKKVFGAISESKEAVKTEILKTLAEDGGKASIMSAKCDGTTLYFVVGAEKGKDDKIMFITTDKSAALKGGN